MTQLTDLQATVYTITNRPELVSETLVAIKKATLKAHNSETYARDLVEVSVTGASLVSVSSSDFRYQIAIGSSPISRFRRIAYLREIPTATGPYGLVKQYRFLEADSIFDSYNVEHTDYAYLAGATINLRTQVLTTGVKVGYYQYPDVTDAGFNSWIADLYPAAITDDAAATVFKMIGKDDEETRYRQLAAENYHILQAMNIY